MSYLEIQLEAINYIIDLKRGKEPISKILDGPKAYVYKLTHKISGQFYYGYRENNIKKNRYAKDDLGIKYFSSSDIIKKLGFENFYHEILCECNSGDRAYDIEQVMIMLNLNNSLILNGQYINIFTNERWRLDGNGNKNPAYDHTIYHWWHPEYGEEYLTQYDFREKYNNLSRSKISGLKSNTILSHMGWRLFDNKDKIPYINNRSPEIYHWIHKSGKEEYLTPHDMYTKYDMSPTKICAVVHKRIKSSRGWSIKQQ